MSWEEIYPDVLLKILSIWVVLGLTMLMCGLLVWLSAPPGDR